MLAIKNEAVFISRLRLEVYQFSSITIGPTIIDFFKNNKVNRFLFIFTDVEFWLAWQGLVFLVVCLSIN